MNYEYSMNGIFFGTTLYLFRGEGGVGALGFEDFLSKKGNIDEEKKLVDGTDPHRGTKDFHSDGQQSSAVW